MILVHRRDLTMPVTATPAPSSVLCTPRTKAQRRLTLVILHIGSRIFGPIQSQDFLRTSTSMILQLGWFIFMTPLLMSVPFQDTSGLTTSKTTSFLQNDKVSQRPIWIPAIPAVLLVVYLPKPMLLLLQLLVSCSPHHHHPPNRRPLSPRLRSLRS